MISRIRGFIYSWRKRGFKAACRRGNTRTWECEDFVSPDWISIQLPTWPRLRLVVERYSGKCSVTPVGGGRYVKKFKVAVTSDYDMLHQAIIALPESEYDLQQPGAEES